ncbi:hypothetical protein MASR1M42_15310 [Azonexus hydrophilus]
MKAPPARAPSPKRACAASVSNLNLPDAIQPWETEQQRAYGKPSRIASALDIMLEGPIGAAAFNNEFGRPNLTGYFRTYEQDVPVNGEKFVRGYHKPIMIAGGPVPSRPSSRSRKKPSRSGRCSCNWVVPAC